MEKSFKKSQATGRLMMLHYVNGVLKLTAVKQCLNAITIIAMITMASCQEESIQKIGAKTEYSFSIAAHDKSQLHTSIRWGVNSLTEVEHVDTYGFGSSIDLSASDEFILAVDTPGLYVHLVNIHTKQERRYDLQPNIQVSVPYYE